jgi:poly(3-hydroxybutyrate) depolymerase
MITPHLEPAVGRGVLPFVDGSNSDLPIEVNYYRPAAHGPEDRIVIVQHGMLRNGDDYRDFWIEAAEKHRLLIAAPTFPNDRFPQPESYNNGLVIGQDGGVRARDSWLYGIPALVLAALRAGGVTRRKTAHMFGHSAGGQFVHRLLATQDETPFDSAMASNAGWYTLPTLERRFPEGLGGIGLGEADLGRWFAFPMIIFAGDQDIDTADPNLPAQPEALAQGPNRYSRAHFFHDFAAREAGRLSLPFNWRLVTVPGIGHDGAAMSRAAAAWWFEGRIPAATELKRQEEVVL